jgi:hypothetical protein
MFGEIAVCMMFVWMAMMAVCAVLSTDRLGRIAREMERKR